MQRLRDDRGAVAVLTALLLIPLLVCAALVVDIGASYVLQRQLQNAADAAALAIAQDCGKGGCGNVASTATFFATANVPYWGVTPTSDKRATSSFINDDNGTTSKVAVTIGKKTNYMFGLVIPGVNNSMLAASATASWGSVTGGTAVIPLTFWSCSFLIQTSGGSSGNPTTVLFEKSQASCPGLNLPGGFGWLDPDAGQCTATTSLAGQSPGTLESGDWWGNPGNHPPSPECNSTDFSTYLDKTVLLPLYNKAVGNGRKIYYHVNAYAAFRLTGYSFGGNLHSPTPPCSNPDRCIQGYFLKIIDRDTAFTYGAGTTGVGSEVVTLTS